MANPVQFIREQLKASWNHADLKARIITPVMLVLCSIIGFAGFSFYKSDQSILLEELSVRGQAIAASLSVYASSTMTRDNKQALESHVVAFIKDKKLLHHVSFYRGQERYLTVNSDSLRGKIRPHTLKHYRLPVYSPDGKSEIGRVEISLSTQEIEDYLAIRVVEIVVVAVLVVLTSTILLSWLLTRVVIRPLERLTHKIQMISMGRLNHKVVSMSWDEIGHLFRDINALRVRFKRKEDAFINAIIHRRKFHPEDVEETFSHALVIDDDPVIQMHAKALLEKNNIQVTLAGDGKQGLQALFDKGMDFDLVLLDLGMPEMGGYEVLQEIRKQPEYDEIPVIVVSSTSDKASIVRALKNGAADFIIKPFDNNELMARVNIHLSTALREKELDNIIDDRIASLKSL